jgi:spermidine dehydrogenase
MERGLTNEDRQLGMGRAITRRDFINGVSVAVGGALAPTKTQAGTSSNQAIAADAGQYPPLRSGMRGAHPGSFEAAHAARDRRTTW